MTETVLRRAILVAKATVSVARRRDDDGGLELRSTEMNRNIFDVFEYKI